jgi:hypothetical protein
MGSGRPIELADHLGVVHPYLVQLEELRHRFLIALFRGVQKPTALIHLFFFGVGSCPSFHAIPFARARCAITLSVIDNRRKIAELYQNPR